MIDYQPLVDRWLTDKKLSAWARSLPDQIAEDFHERRYGDMPKWLAALEQLPDLQTSSINLTLPSLQIGSAEDASASAKAQLEQALRQMHPWRKGPFDFFGLRVDTEWRSDLKWLRLEKAIEPVSGKRILDVGCGSGYHCWRMRGAGASEVIGIDPSPLFVLQFWAAQKYIQDPNVWVLPLGIQHVPENLEAFDSVFSMGVLYHRRSPLDHLQELKGALTAGGELILETLVIDAAKNNCLVPRGRYARMGNVWFIPSCDMLALWLEKLGYRDIQLVDVTATTSEEQRSTDWMRFQSLADFLHPEDTSQSIEGYPAPVRAIFTARK